MLAPQSGRVPARGRSSPGYLKEGGLEDELRVEVRLVREGRAGLLDRAEGTSRADGVARLLEIDVDAEGRIAAGRADEAVAQDRGRREQHPVDEVALGPPLLAVMPFLQPPHDAAVGVLDAAPVVGELGELLVEGLLQALPAGGSRLEHHPRRADRSFPAPGPVP